MADSPNKMQNVSVAEFGSDGRMHAPSAARNAEAITEVLTRIAPQTGRALELASGTGQHVVGFARAIPGLIWQPTEIDAKRRQSIDTWSDGVESILPAVSLDAAHHGWGEAHHGQDLIVVINLLHLISAAQVQVLIAEAAQALQSGGRFVIYGPFLRDGVATSDGDERFDASLRAADPAIGYKDLDMVRQWLAEVGLNRVTAVDMPANNLTLIAEQEPEAT